MKIEDNKVDWKLTLNYYLGNKVDYNPKKIYFGFGLWFLTFLTDLNQPSKPIDPTKFNEEYKTE